MVSIYTTGIGPGGLFQDYNIESDNIVITHTFVSFYCYLNIHSRNERNIVAANFEFSYWFYTMSDSGRVIKTLKTLYNARFSNA